MKERLGLDCVILLDDASRDDESAIARRQGSAGDSGRRDRSKAICSTE